MEEELARQDFLINIATKVSLLSEHQFRIGAVIANGRRVISFGTNKYKSHPRQINPHTLEGGKSIHAELDALIRAPYPLINGSSIYVIRLLRDGTLGYSRPCSSCITVLQEYGIKRMIYINQEGTPITEDL